MLLSSPTSSLLACQRPPYAASFSCRTGFGQPGSSVLFSSYFKLTRTLRKVHHILCPRHLHRAWQPLWPWVVANTVLTQKATLEAAEEEAASAGDRVHGSAEPVAQPGQVH